MITEERLKELDSLVTDDEWSVVPCLTDGGMGLWDIHTSDGVFGMYHLKEDAEAIVATRSALRELIEEVRRLQTVEKRLLTVRKEVDFALKVIPGEGHDQALRDALWMIDQLALDIKTGNPITMEYPQTITYEPDGAGGYKSARGIFDWQPGDEPAEMSLNRLREKFGHYFNDWQPEEDHVTGMDEKSKLTESITGTVMFHRSKDSDCVCCNGEHHIYGMDIRLDEVKPSIYAGLVVDSVGDFIHEWLSLHKHDGIEGKRVKISIGLNGDHSTDAGEMVGEPMEVTHLRDYGAYCLDCEENYVKPMGYDEWLKVNTPDDYSSFHFTRPAPSEPVRFFDDAARKAMEAAL